MSWEDILKINAYDGVRQFIKENQSSFAGEGWDFSLMRGQLFKDMKVRGKESRKAHTKQLKLYLNELLGEGVLSKDKNMWKKERLQ